MSRICIIPARGGSTRIPKKNIRPFLGKPLIAWSIEHALKTGLFERVIVTTDSEEIAAVAREYGAEVPFRRDPALSDNYVSSYAAVIDAYKSRIENDLLNIYKKATSIQDVVLQIFDYFTHLSSFEHGLFEKISNNLSNEVQDMILSALERFGGTINEHLEETLRNKNIEITSEVREQINLRREIIFSILLASIVEMTIGRISLDETRANLIKKLDIIIEGFGDINKLFGDN